MDEKEMKLQDSLVAKINSATEYRKAQRDEEYINNQAHYENVYYNLATYSEDSPFVLRSDINHVKNAIDERLASLFTTDYSGDIKPKSPNDIKAVETLNSVYKNEWKRLEADSLVKKCIKSGAILGDGYIEITFDADSIDGGTNTRNEGFIKLNELYPTTIYLDPSSDNIDGSDFLVSKTRKTFDWVKRNKPEWAKKLEDNSKTGGKYSDGQQDGEMLAGRDYVKEQKNIYMLNTIYVKKLDTKTITDEETGDEEEVKYTKIMVHYLINGVLLETNENFPFDFYPIEKFSCEEMPQSPYAIPLMRGLTSAQKVANLIESSINNVAMHYTIPTWIISDEANIDIDEFAKFQAALGTIWMASGDINKAIAQLPYPKIDAELVNYGREFVQYIRTYAGVSSRYTGNLGTAANTASGTSDVIDLVKAIDVLIIEQIELFVTRLSKKIIKYIAHYYGDRTIFVREDKDKETTFKEFKLEKGITEINTDILTDLSYKTKNDSSRQYTEYKNIYQMQNQYKDPNPLITSLDLVKAAKLDSYDELSKRYSDMSEESYSEKIDLALQLFPMLQIADNEGNPIVTPEEFQAGMVDIFNDDNTLDTAKELIQRLETIQTEEKIV